MLVIGSRGSKLALWQANYIREKLDAGGHHCRIEIIQTSGDRFQSGPLKLIGNKGLFTKEIEDALLEGRIDLAVHSLKDMPSTLPNGLVLTATPEREDPRDALVGHDLAHLPTGASVGTGSLRRLAQLAHLRPDLRIEGIRGNVDTRLRKLDEGQYDAIVLAASGLHRLGWSCRIAEHLNTDVMCPAAGQGSLAIETRADGGVGMQACEALDHLPTRAAVTAERAVLRMLGGGCHLPVGAYASAIGDALDLRAVVISPDGGIVIRRACSGTVAEAEDLGSRLGQELLEEGAQAILDAAQ